MRTRVCRPALVEAAKKSEIASAEFQQNSIPDLAASWSQALAGEGRESPAQIVDAMKKVTVADVNRVAKLICPWKRDRCDAETVGIRRSGRQQGFRRSRGDHGGAH